MRTNGELFLARAVLPLCRVVFDVGANVGDWTKAALTINPDAQYHCFEPSPTTFAALSARHFPSTVRLNNLGLGSVSEQRTLFAFGKNSGANSLYYRIGAPSAPHDQEAVKLRTFDEYSADSGLDEVDFAKIDVEGHELRVLQGASCALSAGRLGVVQFEYGGTYIDARVLLKDIWDLISGCNTAYSFYKLFPDGPRYVGQYDQRFETFQYSNWVIVRPDWVARLRLEGGHATGSVTLRDRQDSR